ncbi:MAG: hypothetical protein LBH13_05980 [Cellulomonadaceae bacterium]|jgi:hypothetical protein|nr:hypothetical protein [Cellulomonadaceae bacterium]
MGGYGSTHVRANTSIAQVRRWAASPAALWTAFVLVHGWVVVRSVRYLGSIFGDVDLYQWWATQGMNSGWWPVLNFSWVYPAGALVPVTAPAFITHDRVGYRIVWVVMVTALNAIAFAVLLHRRRWTGGELAVEGDGEAGFNAVATCGEPVLDAHTTVNRDSAVNRNSAAAWWWLLFLAALGPIWLGRLDGVIAPLMLVALLEAQRRPALATALATFGAWIKIAPAAVVVAMLASATQARAALRKIVLPGAVVSVVVVGLAVAGGAGSRAWAVFGEQQARGLQAESVAATWFSVARLWNPSVSMKYNSEIFTFEVDGAGAAGVARALDVVLLGAMVAIALLTLFAARRANSVDVLLTSTFTMVVAMIVFNKVGSPQFQAWLGPCVAAGIALASAGTRKRWIVPGVLVMVAAVLTQVIYPMVYGPFLTGRTDMIVVGAARNLLMVALLGWGVWALVRLRGDAAGVSTE